MRAMPGETFESRLHALMRPEAFPFPLATDEPAQVIQTHASAEIGRAHV